MKLTTLSRHIWLISLQLNANEVVHAVCPIQVFFNVAQLYDKMQTFMASFAVLHIASVEPLLVNQDTRWSPNFLLIFTSIPPNKDTSLIRTNILVLMVSAVY